MNSFEQELVIRFLESQVADLTRQSPSEDLGHRLNELGDAYNTRSAPGAPGDKDRMRALECYGKALAIFSRMSNPKWWAAVHYNMGNTLSDMQVDRAENLERAIECYRNALQVYQEQDPELRYDWATTHYELGLAFSNRVRGSQRENLSRSIEHYQEALKVFNAREYPEERRCTQQNLSGALADLADIP